MSEELYYIDKLLKTKIKAEDLFDNGIEIFFGRLYSRIFCGLPCILNYLWNIETSVQLQGIKNVRNNLE